VNKYLPAILAGIATILAVGAIASIILKRRKLSKTASQ